MLVTCPTLSHPNVLLVPNLVSWHLVTVQINHSRPGVKVRNVLQSNYVDRLMDLTSPFLIHDLLPSSPPAFLLPHSLFSSSVSLCCGMCLFSLSWALVLFSRACCLIRPGHLAMPPAALLCQLLWRAGMLGARVASLMFFTSVFGWWVCGVIGEWLHTHTITHIYLCNNAQKLTYTQNRHHICMLGYFTR